MVLKREVKKWNSFIDEWVAGASHEQLQDSYPQFTSDTIQPAGMSDTGTRAGYKPLSLSDFIGQSNAIKDLIVQIESAKKRNSPLNHVAFYGPPGLGKTTLARIIANELGTQFSEITGHSITAKKVEATLLSLKLGDLLFVDEIHAIKTKVAEMLYSPMQDFVYEGYCLPQFTLVGATTNLGKLPKPMRDRIVHQYVFTYYSMEEIATILTKHGVTKQVAKYISQRAKGVPRHAVQFLIKIRGYVDKYSSEEVKIKHCREAFIAMEIDDIGMLVDRRR